MRLPKLHINTAGSFLDNLELAFHGRLHHFIHLIPGISSTLYVLGHQARSLSHVPQISNVTILWLYKLPPCYSGSSAYEMGFATLPALPDPLWVRRSVLARPASLPGKTGSRGRWVQKKPARLSLSRRKSSRITEPNRANSVIYQRLQNSVILSLRMSICGLVI